MRVHRRPYDSYLRVPIHRELLSVLRRVAREQELTGASIARLIIRRYLEERGELPEPRP